MSTLSNVFGSSGNDAIIGGNDSWADEILGAGVATILGVSGKGWVTSAAYGYAADDIVDGGDVGLVTQGIAGYAAWDAVTDFMTDENTGLMGTFAANAVGMGAGVVTALALPMATDFLEWAVDGLSSIVPSMSPAAPAPTGP